MELLSNTYKGHLSVNCVICTILVNIVLLCKSHMHVHARRVDIYMNELEIQRDEEKNREI